MGPGDRRTPFSHCDLRESSSVGGGSERGAVPCRARDGGQGTLPAEFFIILLGFLEGRIVDPIGQNQPDQCVLHTGDPTIIRETLTLGLIR